MTRERLDEAIRLREEGRAKQDQSILDEARALLLELVAAYPEDAEINFQAGVAHDNSGLGREAIPFYEKAIARGLAGKDLERCLLGLGSTYRGFGEYEKSVATLRRGVQEFPEHRGLQIFLAMALYNSQNYREAMEIALTNLMETTADETLQYFKRPISYYAKNLDEVWE